MKVRWIGMSIALLPIICQLTWLPDWHREDGRYVVDVGYWLLCVFSGVVGAIFGFRSPASPHWGEPVVRLLIFLGIVLLGTSVGEYSGCNVMQRLPDKTKALP